jgi:hypothetical protein
MRVAFMLALLAASSAYTWWSFAELSFLSSTGRLGPGFFPRIIGVALILCCLGSLWADRRRIGADRFRSSHWRVVGLLVILNGLFVFALPILGGVLAMVVFLLVTLSILNRGGHARNIAIAVALPAFIHVVFDVWLNATMPEGVVPLPF